MTSFFILMKKKIAEREDLVSGKIRSGTFSYNRITECSELEGTSEGHPVQPPC